MFENRETKILHVGEIGFPLDWETWYKSVAEITGHRFSREHRPTFDLQKNELNNYDLIRISSSQAAAACKMFPAASHMVSRLQYVDCIAKKKGVCWPLIINKEALHSLILIQQPFLNFNGAGLIVGLTIEAIIAAHVFVLLGIKHITLITDNVEEGAEWVKKLSASMFQVHFEVLPVDKIIMLPGIYSVMACFENLDNKEDLLTSLVYFNYLERGGLVISGSSLAGKDPFIEEAGAIGANFIDLRQIQTYQEVISLGQLLPIPIKTLDDLTSSARSK